MRAQEKRRAYRVRIRAPLVWRYPELGLGGRAKIENISTTGMLLSSRKQIPLNEEGLLSFSGLREAHKDFLPRLGRIVWSRKRPFGLPGTLAGIEFVSRDQDVLRRLRDRVQQNITRINNFRLALNILGMTCLAVFFVLAALLFYQQIMISRNHEHALNLLSWSSRHNAILSRGLHEQMAIKDRVIREVYKELDVTKAMLAQTEDKLAETSSLYLEVREQLASFEQALGGGDLNPDQIATFERKNQTLKKRVQDLEKGLALYETRGGDLNEARRTLSFYRGKIREVKDNIRELRRETRLARIRAQDEMDRVKMKFGNNGFLIRDGVVVPPYAFDEETSREMKVRVEYFE